MNFLADDPRHPWQSEAYYLAARRRVVEQAGGASLWLIEITAGGQLLPHVQPRRAWYCCIGGAGLAIVEEREQPLAWGVTVRVGAGVIHAFDATGDAPLYLLMMQADEAAAADAPPAGLAQLLGKLAGRLN